jgi:hypothetical protein
MLEPISTPVPIPPDRTDLHLYQPRHRLHHRLWNYTRRQFEALPAIDRAHQHRHQQAIKRHSLPPLHPQNQQALQSLRQNGIFITHLEQFHLDRNCLALIQPHQTQLALAKPERQQYCISAPRQDLPQNLFRWGLQPQLLNLVENYLELPIAYHGFYLRRDLVTPLMTRSRRWHLDMEDHRILKVIIYLNDVDQTTGPFQYLDDRQTQQIQQQFNYRHGYLKTPKVETLIPPQQWQSCTGSAGTVIIVDTARLLHRGKASTEQDRYALFYDYTSRSPKRPYYCKSSLPLPALQNMNQHLSPAERPLVFWR